jgi:hypothetical protein
MEIQESKDKTQPFQPLETFPSFIMLFNKQVLMEPDSSVGIATGYGLDDQEGREFVSR